MTVLEIKRLQGRSLKPGENPLEAEGLPLLPLMACCNEKAGWLGRGADVPQTVKILGALGCIKRPVVFFWRGRLVADGPPGGTGEHVAGTGGLSVVAQADRACSVCSTSLGLCGHVGPCMAAAGCRTQSRWLCRLWQGGRSHTCSADAAAVMGGLHRVWLLSPA